MPSFETHSELCRLTVLYKRIIDVVSESYRLVSAFTRLVAACFAENLSFCAKLIGKISRGTLYHSSKRSIAIRIENDAAQNEYTELRLRFVQNIMKFPTKRLPMLS